MSYNQHIQVLVSNQEKAVNKTWMDCIAKYGPNLASNVPYVDPETSKTMCPPYFDTIYCWPPQLPNTTSAVPCPSYIIGFTQGHNATRQCKDTGEWYTRNGVPYTNYSACFNETVTTIYYTNTISNGEINVSLESVKLMKVLSETGYAVSLISLIIAFTIMFKIKKLHCARNILHMNLFASFILRSFMHILKDALFEDGLGLSKDLMDHNGTTYFHVDSTLNNFECKLLVSVVQYFTAANYSWILMEGVYLNNLILRALFTDSNRNLAYYILFGWGLPLLVVIPWVIARILVEDSLCWTTNDNLKVFAIIIIPTLLSVLINLILFIIISVVLYNKLKSPGNEDSRRYLKWAKSTLVLVPLFGVNYAFFLIFYFLNEKMIWMLCDILFGSFQGFFVAILYCFMNGEVKAELKPHINNILFFLATNSVTKCCFPRREKYLRFMFVSPGIIGSSLIHSVYQLMCDGASLVFILAFLGNSILGFISSPLFIMHYLYLSYYYITCHWLGTFASSFVSAAGRQSVCTTMSCSSLCNNGLNHHRNGKTKFDHLSKIKMAHLHGDTKEMCTANGVRYSVPKNDTNGHYAPNLTFVHGRYSMNMTTPLDLSFVNDVRPHQSQNLPTCEEEVSMIEEVNLHSQKPEEDSYRRFRMD